MQELRVLLETKQTINDEIRSAWFALPIDEEELRERLGVDAESEDYRILEKELPFADDVGEDTTIERLNDMYRTFESLPADLKEDYDELMCYFSSLDELHQHRNDIIHYSWCKNMTDVAHRVLDNDPVFFCMSAPLYNNKIVKIICLSFYQIILTIFLCLLFLFD